MSVNATDSPLDRVPIVQSVVGGLAAFVLSFVVIAILVAGTEDGDDLVGFSGNVLYNAHFVDVQSKISSPMGSSSEMTSILSEGSTELSEYIYYAIPLIVLLVVAIGVVRIAQVEEPTDGAIAGAAMAVGYLVLTIVGTFVVEYETSGSMGTSATVSPQINAMTIVLMGIVYPAVVGAVGGVVGSNL